MSRPDTTRCQRAVEGRPEIPWGPSNAPNFSLDKQVAQARREMGEDRWAQLNREWEEAPFAYGLMAGMDEGTA